MSAQRSHDTDPERQIRSLLHGRGLRFRVHVRPLGSLRREADLVFTRAKLAVFVDGCFWHGCPEHASWPKSNASWWRDKIERNRARDVETDTQLRAAGWRVIRIWEHEDPRDAARSVESAVRSTSRLGR
jgi:DNA mismatch endonuclease (patch repair protein)